MHSRLRLLGIAGTLLLSSISTAAQRPPGTDIYLVEVRTSGGNATFVEPVNITDRAGYDNQPSFLPDGRSVLYTSNRGGQTDIYQYFVRTKATEQVTHTNPESEYSATVTPTGETFSVIRVEADSTQRLWQFDLDGSNPRVILTDIAPVGYHAWADEHTLALFVLGQPSTLQVADTRSGHGQIVAYNIGRSVHKVPGRNVVSFTHRVPDFWIKELDPESRSVRPLVRLLEGNEFYAWMPDGSAITGQGSKLFRWDPRSDAGWEEVADFTTAGIRGLSRIAVSPDGTRLAVVGTRPEN